MPNLPLSIRVSACRKKYKPEEGHNKEEEIHVQHPQTQEKFLKDEVRKTRA